MARLKKRVSNSLRSFVMFSQTSCDSDFNVRNPMRPGDSFQGYSTPRSALTLIELLVVVAIIGMLIGLIIPAIRAARGTSKNASCKNNLRQMGFALEMHRGDLGSYPADSKNGYGIAAFLLPYVEQNRLYGRLKPAERRRPAHIASPNLGGQSVSVFLCPTIGGGGMTVLELGRGTYLGTNHLFPWRVATNTIRDGNSNTIAMGETLVEHSWVLPGTAEAIPPGGENGFFGSRHVGGANFVFCDTSVHFISDDIDPDAFAALCTIDGGEPVTEW